MKHPAVSQSGGARCVGSGFVAGLAAAAAAATYLGNQTICVGALVWMVGAAPTTHHNRGGHALLDGARGALCIPVTVRMVLYCMAGVGRWAGGMVRHEPASDAVHDTGPPHRLPVPAPAGARWPPCPDCISRATPSITVLPLLRRTCLLRPLHACYAGAHARPDASTPKHPPATDPGR